MTKTDSGYTALDLDSLSKKKHKIISTSEALADVIPVDWGENVFNGKEKVVVAKSATIQRGIEYEQE